MLFKIFKFTNGIPQISWKIKAEDSCKAIAQLGKENNYKIPNVSPMYFFQKEFLYSCLPRILVLESHPKIFSRKFPSSAELQTAGLKKNANAMVSLPDSLQWTSKWKPSGISDNFRAASFNHFNCGHLEL